MLHTTGFGGGRKGCGRFQCIGAFGGVGGFALSGSALNSAARGWASGNLGRRHHQGGVVPHSPLGPRNRHYYTCASAAEGRGSPGAAPPPNAFANRPAACRPREQVSGHGPFLAHARTPPLPSLPPPPCSPGAVPLCHLARTRLPAPCAHWTLLPGPLRAWGPTQHCPRPPDPQGPTSGPVRLPPGSLPLDPSGPPHHPPTLAGSPLPQVSWSPQRASSSWQEVGRDSVAAL